jgi:phosphatidylserine/phosphatidylglycerophosphate/cardiolipin synthase-like enzyme
MARLPYASVYFSPDRGSAANVIGFIGHTAETLDIAVYAITHPAIAVAVIGAHQRGVAVRVLMDKVQASSRYSLDEVLDEAGVPLRRDRHAGSMHNKMAISDATLPGRSVALGSFNWTRSADERNAESLVIIRLKYVVEDCAEEFERLWAANS